jgi:hypothetical protein
VCGVVLAVGVLTGRLEAHLDVRQTEMAKLNWVMCGSAIFAGLTRVETEPMIMREMRVRHRGRRAYGPLTLALNTAVAEASFTLGRGLGARNMSIISVVFELFLGRRVGRGEQLVARVLLRQGETTHCVSRGHERRQQLLLFVA